MRRIIRTEHLAYDSLLDRVHRGRRYFSAVNVLIPLGDPIADPFEMPQFNQIDLMEEWDDIADVLFCECIRKLTKD